MTDLLQTFHDLVRVETLLWNAVDAALQNDCGLTLARLETMQVIDRSGPCRVLDIAQTLAIGWSGASKIVDRVEAAGHCRRRPNPQDARSSLISLTPRGRALLDKANRRATAELEQRLGASPGATDLADFSRSLSRLHAALRSDVTGQ